MPRKFWHALRWADALSRRANVTLVEVILARGASSGRKHRIDLTGPPVSNRSPEMAVLHPRACVASGCFEGHQSAP